MGPTATPTAADRQRFQAMQELGCLISFVFRNRPHTVGEVHHLVEGGRRLGHQQTLYLHPWYHRGVPPMVWEGARMVQLSAVDAGLRYGPSMALHPAEFRQQYGSQQDLLAMQNELVAHWLRLNEAATV